MGKRISTILIIIFIFIIWQTGQFFSSIKETVRETENDALSYLEENIEIKEVVSADFYHGSESFHVFQGLDETGEEIIIWIPSTLETYTLRPKKEGLSIDEVRQFVEQELNPKELVSIKLGMENTIPLYEIIYIDQEDRYSYYFVSFKDGSYLKHYHLGM